MEKLMIVESPNKVKTIKKYLDDSYEVISSVGHILKMSTRGTNNLGIDFDNWEPIMVPDSSKSKVIKELKQAAKEAKIVLVATDPDREGEAIAQNLVDTLKIENKYQRIKYNEITQDAIKAAIDNPLEIDKNLVEAQKTRRMLDRIIGFKLSQLMKAKVKNTPTNPSAGRVQSIALKLVCDREKEIERFIPTYYSKIEAKINKCPNASFYYPTELCEFKNDNTWISRENIEEIFNNINSSKKLKVIDFKVSSKKEAQHTPFKQSILYKEAKYSAQVVQSSAQKLFEEGIISYPRTDSTRLSATFIEKAKKYIEKVYGKEYVGESVKGTSGDQDAHEAIRPTNIELTPDKARDEYKLSDVDYQIYKTIYNKTICAIMASPIREIRRYELLNEGNNHQYNFRLSFTNVTFDGYYKVIGYEEKDNGIINFKVGDYIDVDEYIREDKETQPPARYNDGSLIKMLDDIKVGRPSTFASTISVIKKRLFVETINGALHPTEFGKVVLEKLIEGFPDTITEEYTAQVEELLDEISVGKSDYKLLLKEFWEKFTGNFEYVTETMEISTLPQELVNELCPECGSDLIYRYTKRDHKKFIGCSAFPKCKYLRNIDGQKNFKWKFKTKKSSVN